MGIWSYSGTAASNTSLSGISWAEGMSPANLNNGVRAMAADLKNWSTDLGGKLTAGGTADVLTLTTAGGVPSYYDGLALAFVASAENTTSATLNVDGVGAKQIRKVLDGGTNDEAVWGGDIRVGQHCLVHYDASANSSAGAWILLNPAAPRYEPGTFTPTITYQNPGTSSATYATQTGTYTRIGNAVRIRIFLTFTPTIGTASGAVRIAGLPFAAAEGGGLQITAITTFGWDAGATQVVGTIASGVAYVTITNFGDGVAPAVLGAALNMTSGAEHSIALAGVYRI